MQSSDQTPLDFSAYQHPISFWDVIQESIGLKVKRSIVIGIFSVLIVLGLGATLLFGSGSIIDVISMVVFGFIFVIAPVFALTGAFKRQIDRTKRTMRLRQFAPANGFTYIPEASTEGVAGLLFSSNDDARSSLETVVGGTYHGLPFYFGNVCFVTGSGKNRSERWYGVLEVTLTRAVPHVLLDSKANNYWGQSNFTSLRRNQRLQLEGDFNNYFDLYVPVGYERDALYFITPELMAILIDKGADFDVELVDNKLLIYRNDPFALEDQEAITSVFQMIDTFGGEFQENTQRYADANVGNRAANIIAKPGQRLKESVPWIIVLIVVGFVLTMVFSS